MPTRSVRIFSLLAVWFAFATPLAASPSDYSYARIVRLSLVEGDVLIARPEEEGWQPALANMPIRQGDTLATSQGRAEIEFESGATARIAENTLLQFTELALAGGGRLTKLTLTQGTATFYANLSRADSFVVLTPHLEAAVPENARFRLDVSDDGSAVSVLKGDLTVATRAGAQHLTKGQSLLFSAGEVSLARNPETDDWDRWVADRDEVITTTSNAALRYVDAPFSYGLADLGNYGNWVFLNNYGHCWQPAGLPIGWSPYWNGRWASVPGIGWTWISYEPWGWVPYHFGRWANTHLGWVWVPGHFNQWQGAAVFWLQIGNFVGWGPLGPDDQPGQLSANFPHGTVMNTPRGIIGGTPNQRANPNMNDRPRLIAAPAIPFDELGDARSTKPAGFRGRAATSIGPSDTSAHPSIVFDPQERRFVNHPTAPGRSAVEETDTRPQAPAPSSRGFSGTVAPSRPLVPHRAEPDNPPSPPARVREPGGRAEMGRVPQRSESIRAVPRQEVARPPRDVAPSAGSSGRMTGRIESPRSAPASAPSAQSPSPRTSSPAPAPRSEQRVSSRPSAQQQ